MARKFCVRCGEELLLKHKFCPKCKTPVKEAPLTEKQKQARDQLMAIQAEHKQNPVIGCLIVIGFIFLLFGLPFIVMNSGIGQSDFLQGIILVVIFVFVNIGLYKYRKSMKFKARKFYNLTVKDNVHTFEQTCRRCGGRVLDDMVYCPRCNASISQDVEVDLKYKKIKPEQIPKDTFCSNCGTEITDNSKFCKECGTKISREV